MSRAAFWSLYAITIALGLACRLGSLDIRPLHHDEANEAVRFGRLLETGEYRYDRNDHHGPALYYLTLPAAWVRGQKTLASLDERTIRIVPVIFGAGVILLLPLLAAGLGRAAVVVSALLAALSPALTYYNRFYIHESLLAFFALGFLIALGYYVLRPRAVPALWAGLFAGLAYSTKETSVIVLVAAAAAAALARTLTAARFRREATPVPRAFHVTYAIGGLAVAALVGLLFYSSFLTNPSGVLDSIRAYSIYVERGIDPGMHRQRWDYYLSLLSFSAAGGLVWSEGLILVLAVAGVAFAFGRVDSGFWPRYVSLYSLITALAFSAVRYKTPWNLLPFHVGFVVLAGSGAAGLVATTRSHLARGLLVVVLISAAAHLAVQNWRANFQYPADSRNPYAYAQTSSDFLRMVQRVGALAALHPDRARMIVKVVAGPYEQWPLPWYLRGMQRVGYWSHATEAGRLDDAALIVASEDNADAVDAALGERYVSELYGLRPGVILNMYMERTLWERFLAARER